MKSAPIRVLKAGLSLFIVYHLLTVFIMPMGQGLVIRELGRYFVDYANLFGFNTGWRFFSPVPGSTFTLEYSFIYPDGAEGEAHILPENRAPMTISDSYQRRMYAVRFLSLTPERMEKYMAPWLCQQDRRAESVNIRQTIGSIENVERHRGNEQVDSYADFTDPTEFPSKTYACTKDGA